MGLQLNSEAMQTLPCAKKGPTGTRCAASNSLSCYKNSRRRLEKWLQPTTGIVDLGIARPNGMVGFSGAQKVGPPPP